MKKILLLIGFLALFFAFVACKGTRETSTTEQRRIIAIPDGCSKGYEYVDLGLSVKWATCNVGASSEEEFGDYFMWGEVNMGEWYALGIPIEIDTITDIVGDPRYDAARAKWGGGGVCLQKRKRKS